jgi:hypothetical protein
LEGRGKMSLRRIVRKCVWVLDKKVLRDCRLRVGLSKQALEQFQLKPRLRCILHSRVSTDVRERKNADGSDQSVEIIYSA